MINLIFPAGFYALLLARLVIFTSFGVDELMKQSLKYPPTCSFCRSATMTVEAFFEPFTVQNLKVSISPSNIRLVGEVICSDTSEENGCSNAEQNGSSRSFSRLVPLRKDLLFTRPRAVLKGDTLTIALRIHGRMHNGSALNESKRQQLPIIRVA